MKITRAQMTFWSLLFCLAWAVPLFAQEQEEKPAEKPPVEEKSSEEVTISGGVAYQPIRRSDQKLIDPFKSPFEIEREEREQRQTNHSGLTDKENRLPYSLSELELRGIYYHAGTGYKAIFRVGSEYKWWPAGTKFRDADLVNITDGAAIFKQYAAEDETQVRDVVRELHRGEE